MYKRFGVGDLNFFAGKHISQICYNWYVSDTLNHCAHFVSHVLGVSETNNCYNALGTPGRTMPGACIRVDELFNDWCQSRGRWHDKPVALHQCLFFISIPSNVTQNPLRFGQLPTKHVGIFIDGMVWHYSNGRRKVVAQPLSQMDRHYAGLKPKDCSSTARSGHDRWVAVPALTALLLASSTGCAVQPPQTSEVRVRHLPPTKGDVIEAAIKSHGVPLSVHYSCSTMVGTQRSTIGDYLAEQILSFSETASKWIDVDFVPVQTPSGYYWHATVMFHFLESNGDPFEYGVRFLIRQSDGGVVPTSFSCPGVP